MPDFPGGFGYQSPSLPGQLPVPTPFPSDLGAFGPLAYMGLQSSGLLPPSLMNFSFTPTTDIHTQFQAIQQFQARTTAMQGAMRGDVASLMRYQRSIAQATGANWGQLEGRAMRASQWIGNTLPILGMMMPEAVDMAMGPQGSQVVMASQLANASRFMFDPTSGMTGMQGGEIAGMSNMLYQQLYGSDSATARMRGIGAGRAGILANEMLARGLLSDNPFQSGPARSLFQGLEVAGAAGGNLGGGLLGATGSGRVGLQGTSQQAEQIRGMTKIISSISDLFGANGQPNAPIPQLLAALDQLGQGAEYRYGANTVESLFRNLQQATITGKISLPQLSQMVGQNAAMLASVGGDPRDAIAMTQRSVNFAAGSSSVFSSPFYGKLDPRTLANASAQLEASGLNSPSGQMAQVALFLAESSQGLAPNSEFSQLVGAIRSGSTTYGGGKSVFQALQGQSLRDIYTGSGGSMSNFNAAAMNPEVARRYGATTAPLTRKLQLLEASQMAAGFIGGDIGDIFGIGGADGRMAVGNRLIEQLFKNGGAFAGMTPQQQAAEIERLAAESASSVGGLNKADAARLARGSAPRLLSGLSGAMSNFTGYDLPGALQVFSPLLSAQGEARDRSNRINADISSALGDLGRYTFSQRLTESLQNMDANTDIGTVLGKLLGGVDKSKIEAVLNGRRGPAQAGGVTLRSMIDSTLKAVRDGGDPDAVGQLKSHFQALQAGLKAQGIDIKDAMMSTDAMTADAGGLMMSASGIGGLGMIGSALSSRAALQKMMTGDKSNLTNVRPTMDINLTGELTVVEAGKAMIKGSGKGEGLGGK